LKLTVAFAIFYFYVSFEIFFAEPERRVDERYHDGNFDERPDYGREGRAVLDAEHADRDGYGQLEIIAGGSKRKRGRLFISGVELHAHIKTQQEHNHEIY